MKLKDYKNDTKFMYLKRILQKYLADYTLTNIKRMKLSEADYNYLLLIYNKVSLKEAEDTYHELGLDKIDW